jgi:RNA polymerase sigma-70 factor (ECF subfamily)
VTERIREDWANEVAKLYRAEASGLFNRAIVLTQGDRQAAEDLVQEAFEAAVKKWRSIGVREDEDRRRWLFVVLQNKTIDRWRADHRTQLDPELLDATLSMQTTDDDETAVQALNSVVIDQIWKEMKIMPPARYRVAYLAWRCGWTDRRIAKAFGIAKSTVRVHRRNAAHQLRSLIVPLMDPNADDVHREGGNDEGGR